MTKEHSHAQVLRWIADGKRVAHEGATLDASVVLENIVEGVHVSYFTLAPRTIKVGSREINAPLDVAPADDSPYYWITPQGVCYCHTWVGDDTDAALLNNGNVWATEADATAARDAWRELMKGQV